MKEGGKERGKEREERGKQRGRERGKERGRERWKERGKERGRERGKERGREQGLVDILNRDQYIQFKCTSDTPLIFSPLKLTERVVAISLYGTGLALLLSYHFAISTAILQ